jgi:hypothetical protein
MIIGLGFATVIIFTLFVAVSNLHNEMSMDSIEIISQLDSHKSHHMNQDGNKEWYEKSKPLITEFPTPSKRNDIIPMLEKLKWKTAIEVGVQKGLFAKKMLDNWPSCTEYKLVDLWGQEEGYQEPGNHSKDFHSMALGQTKRRVKPYNDKVEFFVMRSTDASKHLEDQHFDFVYLDARHDYCAVAEDIAHYWPKVRPGGILAGHDFIDAQYALDRLGENENWGECEDGTKQPRAVRGAVEDFMKTENIDFVLVSQEDFPSWFIQKPYAN